MPFTSDQLATLGQKRKRNPPSFYNSDTGEQERISGTTEDAMILIGSDTKQKAAQYLDLLLDANPSKGDYSALVARAVDKQMANATAALAELEPVVSSLNEFKDSLVGGGSTERIYAEGMLPLLASLLVGVVQMRNRIDALKFSQKINRSATKKHASSLTDAQRKEWRSWKRVLLAYP